MNQQEIRKELEALTAKKDAMYQKHMERYRSRSATRARTTTLNANVSMLNDRITELRAVLKRISCDDGYPSCRQAEATGEWCVGECVASTKK